MAKSKLDYSFFADVKPANAVVSDPEPTTNDSSDVDYGFFKSMEPTTSSQTITNNNKFDNIDPNFMLRATKKDPETISNPDGSFSTHRMRAETDAEGNWYVFPSIVEKQDGSLFEFPDTEEGISNAFNWNIRNNNIIPFGKNKQKAIDFSIDGYKKGTPLEDFKKEPNALVEGIKKSLGFVEGATKMGLQFATVTSTSTVAGVVNSFINSLSIDDKDYSKTDGLIPRGVAQGFLPTFPTGSTVPTPPPPSMEENLIGTDKQPTDLSQNANELESNVLTLTNTALNSSSLIKSIKKHEGVGKDGLYVPYLDSLGNLTVGHGHLLQKGSTKTEYTKQEIDDYFEEDLKIAIEKINKLGKLDKINLNTINQVAYEVLAEMAYNMGSNPNAKLGEKKGLTGFTKTLEAIKNGEYELASIHMLYNFEGENYKDISKKIGKTDWYKQVKENRAKTLQKKMASIEKSSNVNEEVPSSASNLYEYFVEQSVFNKAKNILTRTAIGFPDAFYAIQEDLATKTNNLFEKYTGITPFSSQTEGGKALEDVFFDFFNFTDEFSDKIGDQYYEWGEKTNNPELASSLGTVWKTAVHGIALLVPIVGTKTAGLLAKKISDQVPPPLGSKKPSEVVLNTLKMKETPALPAPPKPLLLEKPQPKPNIIIDYDGKVRVNPESKVVGTILDKGRTKYEVIEFETIPAVLLPKELTYEAFKDVQIKQDGVPLTEGAIKAQWETYNKYQKIRINKDVVSGVVEPSRYPDWTKPDGTKAKGVSHYVVELLEEIGTSQGINKVDVNIGGPIDMAGRASTSSQSNLSNFTQSKSIKKAELKATINDLSLKEIDRSTAREELNKMPNQESPVTNIDTGHYLPKDAPLPYGAFRATQGKNKISGKPVKEKTIQKRYVKYVKDFIPEGTIETTNVFPAYPTISRVFQTKLTGSLRENFSDAIIRQQALDTINIYTNQIKTANREIDPSMPRETAASVLDGFRIAVYSESGRSYLAPEIMPTHAKAVEIATSYGETNLIPGVVDINNNNIFYNKTNANKIQNIVDPNVKLFEEVSISEPTISPLMNQDVTYSTISNTGKLFDPLELAKSIAKGAENLKEFTSEFNKFTEGTPWENMSGPFYSLLGSDKFKPTTKSKPKPKPKTVVKKNKENNIIISTEPPSLYNFIGETTTGRAVDSIQRMSKLSKSMSWIYESFFRKDFYTLKASEPRSTIETFEYLRESNIAYWTQQLKEMFKPYTSKLFPEVVNLKRGGRRVSKNTNNLIFEYITGNTTSKQTPTSIKLAKEIMLFNQKIYDYAKKVFPDLTLEKNWLPRVYNVKKLNKNEAAFLEMLEKNILKRMEPKEDSKSVASRMAEDILDHIVDNQGKIKVFVEGARGAESLKTLISKDGPKLTASVKKASSIDFERVLKDIPAKDLQPYLDTNVYRTLNDYILDTVSRVEYARKFGINNEILYQKIHDAAREINKISKKDSRGRDVPETMTLHMFNRIIDMSEAVQMAYKRDIPSWYKNPQKSTIAFTNLLYLPFAAIRSVPELTLPLGKAGLVAYTKAIPSSITSLLLSTAQLVNRDFKVMGLSKTFALELAESVSLVGSAEALAALQKQYVGDMVGGAPSLINNVGMRINGMVYYMNFAHVQSVNVFSIMVKDFLSSQAKGRNAGWLRLAVEQRRMEQVMKYYQLDINAGIEWYKNGAKADGSKFYKELGRGAKTFAADTVLVPSHVNSPMWFSNPYLAFLKHLKSFPVAFTNTVMKPLYKDVRQNLRDGGIDGLYGNARLGANSFMAFTGALMFAYLADEIINKIKFGEKGNPYTKNMDESKYWAYIADKAGLFGSGSMILSSLFKTNIQDDPLTILAGPVASMLTKITKKLKAYALTGNSIHVSSALANIIPYTAVNKESKEKVIKKIDGFLNPILQTDAQLIKDLNR